MRIDKCPALDVFEHEVWNDHTGVAQTNAQRIYRIKFQSGKPDFRTVGYGFIKCETPEDFLKAVEDGMIVVALEAGASDIALVEAEVEDPTEPSEPADPTDPSEPVDPSEPADPTDPSEPEGGDDNTQTGDSTPIAAMIALTVLVATGMALIVTKRKFF